MIHQDSVDFVILSTKRAIIGYTVSKRADWMRRLPNAVNLSIRSDEIELFTNKPFRMAPKWYVKIIVIERLIDLTLPCSINQQLFGERTTLSERYQRHRQ